MQIFALNATRAFGCSVAACLDIEVAAHEEREFEDGEHKARPLVGVRGRDVYVIQSLHGSADATPHDKLCRLLFFLATLREHGAARVTAVVPYLAYARKDRQTKPRDPVTTRYVASLFEAVGIDRMIALEVHNVAAFQNAFRCETIHLEMHSLFAAPAVAIAQAQSAAPAGFVVASPDAGGMKRAHRFRDALEARLGAPVGSALMEKYRSAGVVSGDLMIGDVAGATVLLVDDLIASGTTMVRAAQAARAAGAASVYALAAHGLFTGDAQTTLASAAIERIFVSDSVPAFRLTPAFAATRLTTISAAPLVAAALRCCHDGGSISELNENGARG